MFIKINRISELNVPFGIFEEINNDWTHFTHLHRKSHKEFRLLHRSGRREIFLYKAYLLYPLPIYSTQLVFREYVPQQAGYRNVYLNVRTGRVSYLNSSTVPSGQTALGIGEFWFDLGLPWRIFPRLFACLFRLRMRRVLEEDNSLMRERVRLGCPESPQCAPKVPEAFDFFDEAMKDGYPEARETFEDRKFDDLSGPGHGGS